MVEQFNKRTQRTEFIMETTSSIQINLPTVPIGATTSSPKNLIIFSKPKTGKTTLFSKLPNCLILDFEEGTDFVEALKVKIIGFNAPANEDEEVKKQRIKENKYYLKEVGTAIKDAKKPYRYIAIDTVTALEDMCVSLAEQLYSKSPMGKNWFGTDPEKGKNKYGNILNLPDGAGYKWLRDAFDQVIGYIKTLAERVILSGHIKDTKVEKEGAEFNSSELDLTGKIKRVTAQESDAIGYLFRRKNKTILSFKTSDEVSCGARPKHLNGQEITIAEMDENGKLNVYWDRIFVD
jgi:hypothetical protein